MTNIVSPIAGNVWKIKVSPGHSVAVGDVVVILESMKTEIYVEAEEAGTVVSVLVSEGASVAEDAVLVVIE
jgi:acetyl-CoA carboxylase biotin carboxyl carrier protein